MLYFAMSSEHPFELPPSLQRLDLSFPSSYTYPEILLDSVEAGVFNELSGRQLGMTFHGHPNRFEDVESAQILELGQRAAVRKEIQLEIDFDGETWLPPLRLQSQREFG